MLSFLAESILSLGLVPAVLLACYVPFLTLVIFLLFSCQKGRMRVSKKLCFGFFATLLLSFLLAAAVLLLYSISNSGI